jgi:hypothetical protein
MPTIFTDGRQGPPGPLAASVTNLELLADLHSTTFVAGTLAYVQAPLDAYYSWSPEDTRTPDGSTVVAGRKGNWILHSTQTGAAALSGVGGVVPLANGVRIEQKQTAAELMIPFSIQPSEPGTGAFQIGTESILFNSTYDNVLHVGYNVFGQVADEPWIRWSLESNYEQTPGQHCVEMHAQILDPALPQFVFNRPFSTQYWRGDGRMFTALGYSDGGHGPGTGQLTITEASTDAEQVSWLTGEMLFQPANYQIIAGNGLTIHTLGAKSLLQFSAGNENKCNFFLDSSLSAFYVVLNGVYAFVVENNVVSAQVPIAISQATPAPAKPAAGFILYVDEADGMLKTIAASGKVTVLASP